MTATVDSDFVALARDAERRLGELEQQRARLSLDALGDRKVRAELDDVESEIATCRQALERVGLAHGERERRDAQARADAECARREKALAWARTLQAERERGAASVDEALALLCGQISGWLATCEEQDRALTAAGRRPSVNAARARVIALEAAVVAAMTAARLPSGVLTLAGLPVRGLPLSQGDYKPVQFLGNDKTEEDHDGD